jgi:hypothetical protein
MNIKLFSPLLFVLLFLSAIGTAALAQSQPAMYFCEKYGDDGEVGVADRFTTGYLTVIVKCDYALDLADCSIQLDKWNKFESKFEYYKKFTYVLEPEMKYVFFAKTDESDLSFDDPGFYRVFLLDAADRTVASALIQIIAK